MPDSIPTNLHLLETILERIHEGIVLCDGQAHILFCNSTAKRLFRSEDKSPRGQSLFSFCSRPPLEQAMEELLKNQENDLSFICATVDHQLFLDFRFRLIPNREKDQKLFIATFEELIRHAGLAETIERSPCAIVDAIRSPLANLRAAAENLVTFPDMVPVMRSAFEKIIAEESASLSDHFKTLAEVCQKTESFQQKLRTLFSTDLLGTLKNRANHSPGSPSLITAGPQAWILADAYAIERLFTNLLLFLEEIGSEVVEICTTEKDGFLYFDFIWQGVPVPSPDIESWRHRPLSGETGSLQMDDVLKMHSSDLWSQRHDRAGYAMVRIPLPISNHP